jgi:hypothetical protein
MKTALACLLSVFASSCWAEACAARSGAGTTALIELYTSEACGTCPPAERWLSSLRERGYSPDSLIPLALHVDYRDYIGTRDAHARREPSLRQRKLTPQQRMALVFTPQVLLQGRDYRRWGTPEFDASVERINAQPSKAGISLKLSHGAAPALDIVASAKLEGSTHKGDAALYLASYEDRQGRYVVLEWQGPFAVRAGERLVERRRLALLPGALPGRSGAAAFVQDRGTGEVLQALMLSACFS